MHYGLPLHIDLENDLISDSEESAKAQEPAGATDAEEEALLRADAHNALNTATGVSDADGVDPALQADPNAPVTPAKQLPPRPDGEGTSRGNTLLLVRPGGHTTDDSDQEVLRRQRSVSRKRKAEDPLKASEKSKKSILAQITVLDEAVEQLTTERGACINEAANKEEELIQATEAAEAAHQCMEQLWDKYEAVKTLLNSSSGFADTLKANFERVTAALTQQQQDAGKLDQVHANAESAHEEARKKVADKDRQLAEAVAKLEERQAELEDVEERIREIFVGRRGFLGRVAGRMGLW